MRQTRREGLTVSVNVCKKANPHVIPVRERQSHGEVVPAAGDKALSLSACQIAIPPAFATPDEINWLLRRAAGVTGPLRRRPPGRPHRGDPRAADQMLRVR